MIVLLLFAFLSGLVTLLAPCIWPLLPIILSSSATGGSRKPLGVTLGIMVSFGFFTLTLTYLVRLFHFDPDILRLGAVAIIIVLGLSLIIPKLSAQLELLVSKLSSKFGGASGVKREGFGGGFLTGLALGVVWTPCAGPILATITALSVTASVNWQLVLIVAVYVTGVGIPLFVFAKLGNHFFSKARALNRYTGRIQQIFGIIMIVTALAILTNVDKQLQAGLLDRIPAYGTFLIKLESNPQVTSALNGLKGGTNPTSMVGKPVGPRNDALSAPLAPEFSGGTMWLNTDKPLTLSDLKGKVVLVDFWTYTCINCIRTLPFVTGWDQKYRDQGLVVIGVHSPEFEFEKKTTNVEDAIKRFKIKYPVVQDNDFAIWRSYNNHYWPAKYLIDSQGRIRYSHFGEGAYEETERIIQELLREAGRKVDDEVVSVTNEAPRTPSTPETYLGSNRMQYYYPSGQLSVGKKNLTPSLALPVNTFSLGGAWTVNEEESIGGKGSTLIQHFVGKKVFLVMRKVDTTDASPAVTVRVLLDGVVITPEAAGSDVVDGRVTVTEDRLYTLVELASPGPHSLTLEFETGGIAVFAFTFG